MKKWVFLLSILFNAIFIIGWLWNYINSPTYELGRLKEDVNVGFFTGEKKMFKLPKGLTVRNISQNGIAAIGQFENNRFEIVLTSDDELVDYNVEKDSLFSFGNFYSVEKVKQK
jgi:hypothetical protein